MLKAEGVTHFKSQDFEISLGGSIQGDMRPTRPAKDVPSETPEEEKPIQHTDMQLTSLLKLSDLDLVDRLFPDHEKEAEESAIDTN